MLVKINILAHLDQPDKFLKEQITEKPDECQWYVYML